MLTVSNELQGRIIDTLYSDTRSVSGLNANLDYPLLSPFLYALLFPAPCQLTPSLLTVRAFLGQLDQWRSDWSVGLVDKPGYTSDPIRDQMREFYWAYYRLFLLSFAVQHALDNPDSSIDLASYCVMCFESAQTMIGEFLGSKECETAGALLTDFILPRHRS